MIDTHIPASVQRLMDRLADVPVLIVTAAGEMLAANPLASALQGDFTGLSRRERTLAWRYFRGTPSPPASCKPATNGAKPRRSRSPTSGEALARYPDDTHLTTIIAELRSTSPRFQSLWSEHRVRRTHARRKTFNHPELGMLTFDCDALAVQGTALQLIVYTAAPGSPGSPSAPDARHDRLATVRRGHRASRLGRVPFRAATAGSRAPVRRVLPPAPRREPKPLLTWLKILPSTGHIFNQVGFEGRRPSRGPAHGVGLQGAVCDGELAPVTTHRSVFA